MIDRESALIFDRRSALFITGGSIMTAIILARMLQLQLFGFKKYRTLSERNATRSQLVPAERGKILSSNGLPLALDESVYRIFIVPDETDDLNGLLEIIKKDLDIKPKDMDKIRRRIARQRGFQPVLIRNGVDWEQMAKLRVSGISGLHIERGFLRRYPGGSLAAHAVGYVGEVRELNNSRAAVTSAFEVDGKAGLERTQNEALSGKSGSSAVLVDAVGRIIGEDTDRAVTPKNGANVLTTIDERIQKRMESSLSAHPAGCAVAMDIMTGAIVAMASSPTFNPDTFSGNSGSEHIEELRENRHKPFMNKSIEGLYPPGSTFKIVVALAALESGAVTPEERIFCPGYWDYGDHRYHCWEKHGHGSVNLEGAIARSCDVYFYQIALRIGIDAIKSMAEKLGLGQAFLDGILPRETIGIIPDKRWKEKNIGAKWVHGDTVISGIGQGFILGNCLQLCVMAARAAGNKKIIPHIIANGENTEFEALGLRKKNINIVMNGLAKVTQPGGTAAGSAISVNGMKMGGKTGTSQVRRISEAERAAGVRTNEQLGWELRNHGLFVGLAPIDDPKFAIAAIAEHAGGSGPAARIAAQTMEEILKTRN
jgi:penicillin-binding protein 2